MAEADPLSAPARREQVPLDTPLFRAYRGDYKERYLAPLHYHEELELVLPQGVSGETWVSGRRLVLGSHSLHVIAPGAVHAFRLWCRDRGAALVIQLRADRCAHYLRGFSGFDETALKQRLLRLPVALDDLRDEVLKAALGFSTLRADSRTVSPLPAAFRDLETVGRIFRILLESGGVDRSPARTDERLRRVLDALEEDLSRPFDLERLARKTAVSKHHLCRLFHRATGMTLTEHLAHARARRAAMLMEQKGLNVTQAAYECGFESVSYFIKVFKRVMGKTPKQWALRRP